MRLLRLLIRVFFPGRPSATRRKPNKLWGKKKPYVPSPLPVLQRPISEGQNPVVVQRKLSGQCFVVDGDTLVIDCVSIRLAGIDAPELDQPYGNKAKWALVNLCRGQVVTAVFDGTSSYDRPVATCYLPDGRDLSEEMVKLGMALDWRKFSSGKYRQFETADARKKLWRADARQKGRFPPVPKV